jgi:succinoglycan biosynthesis transport protein ExoP
MEFSRIWRILVDYKWLLIWLPIIGASVGLGMAYVLPEQYESTALVLARPFQDIKFDASSRGEREQVRDFPVTLSAPIDAPSKTYIEVIKSRAVAVKIVDALKLDVKKPEEYAGPLEAIRDAVKVWMKDTIRTARNYAKYGRDIPASALDQAVEDVETYLVVTARKDTYAFDITYRAGDPNRAAAVANMAAEIFLEQSSESYRSESGRAREFFEKRLDESREALKQARAAVRVYKNSDDTFALTSEYNEKLRMVSDLESTLAKARGKLASNRTIAERIHLKDSPIVVAEEAEIVKLNEQISTLRGQLAAYPDKETRMDALVLTERLAEQKYEMLVKDYEEARVKEAATATDIRIVSRAVPGLYPVKPLKYSYAGLSFAMALVVAIAWALLAESFNPRVRTMGELVDDVGLPVLGTIPALKALRGA